MRTFFPLGHRFLSDENEYLLCATEYVAIDNTCHVNIVNIKNGTTIGRTTVDKDENGNLGLNLEHLKDRFRSWKLIDKDTNLPVGEEKITFDSRFKCNTSDAIYVFITNGYYLQLCNFETRTALTHTWNALPTYSQIQEIYPTLVLVK